MNMRIIIAGVLGGIVMFLWSWLAHDVLGLGEVGVREIPNEAAVLDCLKTNMGDNHGLYIFPGTGLSPNATRQEKMEAMKGVEEKMANGPSGVLIYHPTRQFVFSKLLGVEFATELAEAFLVVFLLALAKIDNFGGRFGFAILAGALTAISTNVSYWNWYGFPKRYTAAYMLIQFVGICLVGIVAALVMGRRTSQTAA